VGAMADWKIVGGAIAMAVLLAAFMYVLATAL
jgi:hypothetical protein